MAARHNACILYIEERALQRDRLIFVLGKEFDVMAASTGLEGLTMLQRRMADLVITDMNLPDLKGDMIAARVLAIARKHIPIVAMTSETDPWVRNRALAAGCVGYLNKPIDSGTLVGA